MNQFPATSSNLSTIHLVYFLQEKYKLSNATKCRLLKAGINHSYLITDGREKFVFRIYTLNWRSKTEIAEEIKLLLKLKENNIAVSYPLFDQQKNYIQQLNAPEGKRYGVLFSYAKGEKMPNVSEEMHFKIGTLMARLHQVTAEMRLERVQYNPQVLLIDSLKQIQQFLPDSTIEMQWMQSTQKYLLREFEKADNSKLRQGIVHLDIWYDNLNISQENEVTLFDFDFCGNGWLCLDIAYYILQLHNVEKDERICNVKVTHFLKGYESITPISPEEKRLFPMLGVSLYFFYLGIQCERFDNWSNSFLNEGYLKRYIMQLIKRYFDLNGLERV